MRILALISLSLLSILVALAQQEQCGAQAGGKVCPGGLCCSQFGYCGAISDDCTDGCQSNCTNTASLTDLTPSGYIGSLISKAAFEQMLKHRNDAACPGRGFYTYEAFIAATKAYGGFGTTRDDDTNKREIAAFLAQTSHETTGGWAAAPDGPYAWGYCFVSEQGNPPDYCDANQQYPCAPGKKYYGRGPIQISYNYNYGPAERVIGSDLLANPDLVATDPTVSFKTALWFWMTPQFPKPSSHDVITGQWTPSVADSAAGRVTGYGVITNLINGGIECGKGFVPQQEDRIGFYKRYCDILAVDYGDNLDCNYQSSFVEPSPTDVTPSGHISSLISKAAFEQMLKHRNDTACPERGFYTYEAFLAATEAFAGFGATGNDSTNKREIAAFLAQTSHETTGGWATAPDEPYAWGYCFVSEQGNPPDYCVASQENPCAPGEKYYGRGPIQITYNFRYGAAGKAIGSDLLANPNLVATNPIVSFKTALWFWMTAQPPQPSSHDVITGQWTASAADKAAGRVRGYGVITNIINGEKECGKGFVPQQEDRIGFYKRYCDILEIGYGDNINCNNQSPFGLDRSPSSGSSNVFLLQCSM